MVKELRALISTLSGTQARIALLKLADNPQLSNQIQDACELALTYPPTQSELKKDL